MSCLEKMLIIIFGSEVEPDPYAKAVDYSVSQLKPHNNTIGLTFARLMTTSTVYMVMVVLVLILILFIIIISLFVVHGLISITSGLICFIICIAVVFLYYMIAIVFATSSYLKLFPGFQDKLSDTILYTFNSVFRDMIYIGLCK